MKLLVSKRPLLEYLTSSYKAIPMACTAPPSTCTRANLGFTTVPQSTQLYMCKGIICPVCLSTLTSAIEAMNGGGEV